MNCFILGLFMGGAVGALVVGLYHAGDTRRINEIRQHYEQELCHTKMALKVLERTREEERRKGMTQYIKNTPPRLQSRKAYKGKSH